EGVPVRSKGPSVAALAALMTLAACLWFDVELSSALFRSVLVYLGVSLMALLYRVILSHYLSVSQERAQQEFLERVQREAESAVADQREAQAEAARAKSQGIPSGPAPAAGSPASPEGKVPKGGPAPGPKPQRSPRPQGEASAEPKSSAVTSPTDKAVETA
ncbi:MAG TPA: hypothetical protein VF398_04170, partial [bacterium]